MQRELEADHEFIVNRLAKLADAGGAALSGSATSLLSPPPTSSTPISVPSTTQPAEADKLLHSRSRSLDEVKSGLLMDSLYTQLAVMHAKHAQHEAQRTQSSSLHCNGSAEDHRRPAP